MVKIDWGVELGKISAELNVSMFRRPLIYVLLLALVIQQPTASFWTDLKDHSGVEAGYPAA